MAFENSSDLLRYTEPETVRFVVCKLINTGGSVCKLGVGVECNILPEASLADSKEFGVRHVSQ